MKKFITTILAVLYICTSTGATLQMHYCMGKLAGWELGHNLPKTCNKCGMEKAEQDNGCCRDEHKFFKDNTDQQFAKAGLQMLQLLAASAPPIQIAIQTYCFPAVTLGNPMSHAPPPLTGIAVYIRNCVFLI